MRFENDDYLLQTARKQKKNAAASSSLDQQSTHASTTLNTTTKGSTYDPVLKTSQHDSKECMTPSSSSSSSSWGTTTTAKTKTPSLSLRDISEIASGRKQHPRRHNNINSNMATPFSLKHQPSSYATPQIKSSYSSYATPQVKTTARKSKKLISLRDISDVASGKKKLVKTTQGHSYVVPTPMRYSPKKEQFQLQPHDWNHTTINYHQPATKSSPPKTPMTFQSKSHIEEVTAKTPYQTPAKQMENIFQQETILLRAISSGLRQNGLSTPHHKTLQRHHTPLREGEEDEHDDDDDNNAKVPSQENLTTPARHKNELLSK
eukprot:7543296-Ditylum_brightwellii.AAC.1